MKDHASRCLVFAAALCGFSGWAVAQETQESKSRFAVSGKYGSIGPGLDLTYGWSRTLHGRLSLSYEPDEDRSGNEEIRAAGSLLLDWHPGGGAFRLSGGLALIHVETALVSSPGGTLGSNELTPYVGVGWGNPLRHGSPWSIVVDVGAFHGGGFSYSTASGAAGVSTETPSSGNKSPVSRVMTVAFG